MSNNKLQKKVPDAIKEKTQYVLTFGVIATMLLVANFPFFVIAFFGIFAYFLWKTFIQPAPNSIKEVFEFYLSANEILRNEERRWFGFEVQEVVLNGELILQKMNGAPPLVYFTLGALYHKIGNHQAAVNHLAYVLENTDADEANYHLATPDLKEYVKILRKIEREPAEAPKMSAAVRALERTRRNRGITILEESRKALDEFNINRLVAEVGEPQNDKGIVEGLFTEDSQEGELPLREESPVKQKSDSLLDFAFSEPPLLSVEKADDVNEDKGSDPFINRKPITEVLHDLYDR